MTEISESNCSNVILLLKQQKYEEALPLLNDLVEKNPSHQEYFIYHLLVLRILILQWNLSRTVTGPVNYSREVVARIIRWLASVVRISERLITIRSLDQIYQSARTSLAKLSIKNVRTAGAYCALFIPLLGFYIIAVSNVESLAPSGNLTGTARLQAVVSASAVKAHQPTKAEVARQDRRDTQLPTETDEENFLQEGVSQPSELLLFKGSAGRLAVNSHLHDVTKRESKISGSHVTTAQVNESNAVAKAQQLKAVPNTENSKVATANKPGGNRTARAVLGEYQSRRAIRIRQSPNFAAKTVQQIDSGILLNVLEFIGSWAKVELKEGGITGFVRREFLISITNDDSSKTDGLAGAKEPTDVATLTFR